MCAGLQSSLSQAFFRRTSGLLAHEHHLSNCQIMKYHKTGVRNIHDVTHDYITQCKQSCDAFVKRKKRLYNMSGRSYFEVLILVIAIWWWKWREARCWSDWYSGRASIIRKGLRTFHSVEEHTEISLWAEGNLMLCNIWLWGQNTVERNDWCI